MVRRREILKRQIFPDLKFHDETVVKFINCMMIDGKKSAVEKAFYGALEFIEGKGLQVMFLYKDGLEVFKVVLENS